MGFKMKLVICLDLDEKYIMERNKKIVIHA